MSDKKQLWLSHHPEKCDVCRTPITTTFYDAKTSMGPWGCLCPSCFADIGIGLGTGCGQQYSKQGDEFVKIRG